MHVLYHIHYILHVIVYIYSEYELLFKLYRYIFIYVINNYITNNYIVVYVYVSVNLSNQTVCKLSENCRQFVKCLFQSVNLFFYACKTLKPGLFWYAVEREPVMLHQS